MAKPVPVQQDLDKIRMLMAQLANQQLTPETLLVKQILELVVNALAGVSSGASTATSSTTNALN